MNGHDYTKRLEQLKRCIPDVFDYKTLLYVGGHAKHGRNLQLSDEFLKHNYKIDVVEVFAGNCLEMANHFKWINHIYLSDIRDFEPKE